MNLAELIMNVRSILREPIPARWSDSDIIRYINNAIKDLAKLSFKENTITLSVLSGTPNINMPADVLNLVRVYWEDENVKRELYSAINGYPLDNTELGTPSCYYVINDKIEIRPIPLLNGSLVIQYIPKPALLVNNTDEPSIKNADEAIISYAVWRALLEDSNPMAQLWEADYVKNAIKWQSLEAENYVLPFKIKEVF